MVVAVDAPSACYFDRLELSNEVLHVHIYIYIKHRNYDTTLWILRSMNYATGSLLLDNNSMLLSNLKYTV